MSARVLALVPDLIMASRIEALARRTGAEFEAVESWSEAQARLADGGVSLLILDLGMAQADPAAVARAAQAAGAQVLAYGPHVDAARLRAARRAGISRVLPRGRFLEDLPGILRQSMSEHR